MTDNDLKDLVLKHDTYIATISQSIEHLAGAISATNRKLDKVVETLGQQNILAERLSSFEEYTKEEVKRNNKRLESLEDSRTWTYRLIIATLLTGLISYVVMIGSGK